MENTTGRQRENTLRTIDLSVPAGSRAKVLLLGNGPNHGTGSGVSWKKAVVDITGREDVAQMTEVPNPLLTLAFTRVSRKERLEKHRDNFFIRYSYEDIPKIKDLLSLPIDVIITTNYTYEIENQLCDEFGRSIAGSSDSDKRKDADNKSKALSKYMCWSGEKEPNNGIFIEGFNHIHAMGRSFDIWHAHGEARRPSSIVFSHDEYVSLMNRIDDYYRPDGSFIGLPEDTAVFSAGTWMDYILYADVYILGFKMDYSESDFWYLLGMRRDNAGEKKGKIIFFEPEQEEYADKYAMLEALDVTVEHLGMTRVKGQPFDYDKFYKDATAFIEKDIKR